MNWTTKTSYSSRLCCFPHYRVASWSGMCECWMFKEDNANRHRHEWILLHASHPWRLECWKLYRQMQLHIISTIGCWQVPTLFSALRYANMPNALFQLLTSGNVKVLLRHIWQQSRLSPPQLEANYHEYRLIYVAAKTYARPRLGRTSHTHTHTHLGYDI
jgi:hypothetical protein